MLCLSIAGRNKPTSQPTSQPTQPPDPDQRTNQTSKQPTKQTNQPTISPTNQPTSSCVVCFAVRSFAQCTVAHTRPFEWIDCHAGAATWGPLGASLATVLSSSAATGTASRTGSSAWVLTSLATAQQEVRQQGRLTITRSSTEPVLPIYPTHEDSLKEGKRS